MTSPLWFVDLLKKYFPYRKNIARFIRFPVIKGIATLFLFSGDKMVYLPKDRVMIHQNIQPPDSILLPSEIVHHFIEQARYLWIMNTCICREADDCQEYPQDLGCLFMGEAVLQIHSKLGQLVTKSEAHQHIQKAQDLGLVHLIGKNKIDSIWMGVSPSEKLLTVCNCCPCCCLFKILPDLPAKINGTVTKMPGVEMLVSDDCIGCGFCIEEEVCFVNAISLVDNRAEISVECRGCGRCVDVCPQDAIQLNITDANYLQNTINIIDQEVAIQ